MAQAALSGWVQKPKAKVEPDKSPETIVLLDAFFDIPPVAKKRPRVTTIGGKARMYQSDSKAQSQLARHFGIRSLGRVDIGVPVSLAVTVVLLRPRKTKYKLAPCARPDCDNYLKMVMDALVESGIVPDDAQITSCTVTKRWNAPLEKSGWHVKAIAYD